jgi:hypothetical protein
VDKGQYDLIVCRYIPEAMMCGLYDYADRLVIDVDDNPCDVERTAARTSRTWRNRMYHRYRAAIIEKVVEKIQRGKFSEVGLNKGYIVYKVNSYLVNTVSDLNNIVTQAQNSEEKVLFVTAISNKGKLVHYAINLSEK